MNQFKFKSVLEYSFNDMLSDKKVSHSLEAFGKTAKSAESKVISMFEKKAENWVSYSHPSHFINCIKTYDPQVTQDDVLSHCWS